MPRDDVNITTQDSAAVDAFSRFRISEPETLFDSKQLFDSDPLIWDDQEESGGSTTSVHSVNKAMTTMGVANVTAGLRTRQTFQRFNYSPGKGFLVMLTGVLNLTGGGSGITQRLGYFDDNNGLFFECDEGIVTVVQRSKATGSVIDTAFPQTEWNVDSVDGEGPSLLTVDWTMAQIFVIDFEWLGVGRIRFGIIHKGRIVYVHQITNFNAVASAYMSTPNLPIRFQIENDGTGAAAELGHMCSTVISEAGHERLGIVQCISTSGVHLNANVADTLYALIGIRLKSDHIGANIDLLTLSLISETNDDFEWVLFHNPVVAGTFTFANETNMAVQSAKGATENTLSGGTFIQGGFGKDDLPVTPIIKNTLYLGSAIDGTVDEIVLGIRPLSANADIQGSINFNEVR